MHSRHSAWYMQTGDTFPVKRMEGIFDYFLEIMLTQVNFDKMKNISILMRKSSNSEGQDFWKLFQFFILYAYYYMYIYRLFLAQWLGSRVHTLYIFI